MGSARCIVIVGAGVAAVSLVQQLRHRGFSGALVVLGAEQELPYDRPPLSKQVLRDGAAPPLLLSGPQWAELDVDLRLGCRATALQPDQRRLQLDGGGWLGYDALVVATGARPIPVPGLTGVGVHALRTHQDAVALRADVRRTGRLTIVGGGFVGCEVAASVRSLGAQVVLVEMLDLPLGRVLGAEVAAEVVAWHLAAGVDLRGGTSVTAVHGAGATRQLQLSDGTTVAAEVVLVAVGVHPDLAWLAGSGVAVDRGVLCDAGGRSNVSAIWSVGDAAQWWVPSLGEHHQVEHWTNAVEQAGVLADNLLAQDLPAEVLPGCATVAPAAPQQSTGTAARALVEHDPVPYVWSEQYGMTLQLAGWVRATDQVTVLRVGIDGALLAVYGRDGRFVGVLTGGAPRLFGRLRKLLRTGASYPQALALASG